MPIVTAPSPSLDSIRRANEVYTLTFANTIDNDAVDVAVLDIVGRGILVAFGVHTELAATPIVSIRVDGVQVVNDETLYRIGNTTVGWNMPVDIGFDTSLLLELRLTGAANAHFWGMALVE